MPLNKQRFLTTMTSSIILFIVMIFIFSNDFSLFIEMMIIFLAVVVGQIMLERLFRRFAEKQVSNQTVFVSFLSMLVVLWSITSIPF